MARGVRILYGVTNNKVNDQEVRIIWKGQRGSVTSGPFCFKRLKFGSPFDLPPLKPFGYPPKIMGPNHFVMLCGGLCVTSSFRGLVQSSGFHDMSPHEAHRSFWLIRLFCLPFALCHFFGGNGERSSLDGFGFTALDSGCSRPGELQTGSKSFKLLFPRAVARPKL